MGDNISSDTLFHFMNEFRFLESTLKGDFSPRYYREEGLTPFFKENVYIAMKCFCDIPLSLVKKHSDFYGKYSIGFTKEWGLKSNLNPLTYYNKDSKFVKHIREAYNSNINIINNYKKYSSDDSILYDLGLTMRSMWDMFLNFKPISGAMYRNGEIIDKYFYDEREWRLIADNNILECTGNDKYLKLRHFYRAEDIEILRYDIVECNNKLAEIYKIPFELKDINFVIVKEDNEVDNVCKIIDGMSKDFTVKNRLKTKIIKYSDIELNI